MSTPTATIEPRSMRREVGISPHESLVVRLGMVLAMGQADLLHLILTCPAQTSEDLAPDSIGTSAS